ncbi:hypothetical protein [Olleya sp. YS]|uniref:hypothetical protein n=1 Tax=Olleya sp. YS TaxID=3028318 RepID=UPI00243438F8|nr:hypothetical protein [Olleya sp. YS]WGD34291.1 hypothetical protein Ollyesu_10940 [Olleya sp. YS]
MSLIIISILILGCKDNSFDGWEKTDDGYYQKTIEPYKNYGKRINKTLYDTLNGTFEVFNKNGTINHRGEFKDGKIYGNLYEYDSNQKLKEYSFIWEDCGTCKDLPAAHYIMKYDSLGMQVDYSGKALIYWNFDNYKLNKNDSLEINVVLAKPPFFETELSVFEKNSNKELFVLPNPKNHNKIKIGFNSLGNKNLRIQYRLAQESSPYGMISTADIDNILVYE